jgi:lipopolysaccharide export system protein LptC
MSDIAIVIGEIPHARAAAFRAARQHSRVIAALRRLVPGFALLLVIGFVVTSFLDMKGLTEPTFDSSGMAVSGSTITMDQPKLTGFNSERRAYEVIASRAEQDIGSPQKIDLSQLAARMQLAGDGWARLESNQGFLDNDAQKLKLNKDVVVTSNTGYTADMTSADVDLESGRVVSEEPVKVTLEAGTINSDRLEIRDGGDLIIFQGRVRMNLKPGKTAAKGNKGAT